ncbi:MAG TPA: hypothetical protein DCX14_08405 [Flavobacteriales bacterium]|jgi:hypothetical protein|nr:hypothetical protein [Flavobacteriales bacterium]
MEVIDKYQIFCDMDGVLVDLVKGVGEALYSKAPHDASANYIKAQKDAREALQGSPLLSENLDKTHPGFIKETRTFLYKVLMDNRRFWMGLKWLPGGKELWDYIKKYDPVILSKPTDLQAVIGKKKWVKDNIGLPKERVQIRYDKSPYASYNGKIGILIDDFESNTSKFQSAGGRTILYKNTPQAIKELKSFGF